MGKYEEAEKWLNRAKAKNRTMTASEYNLGRIAFETGRYDEASKYFESILRRDPGNVIALKAAAYTRIRSGDIEMAALLYDRLLFLVPESADDGYNYALVLFAMKKYDKAEAVLKSHEIALLDNNDVLLLYARCQKEQGKPEAIDTYASWLINNSDTKVRYEYAQLLEDQELYARALENCNVYTLWMDPVLNEQASIMPGLGDAGDRVNGRDGETHPRNIIQLIADYGDNIAKLYRSQLREIEDTVLNKKK
jgi:predicted Zn-dependent protease